MQDYWLQQTDKPLFPDVVWSRPETRSGAGKLFIVGGHSEAFMQPAMAYDAAVKAGIGTARVLVPLSLAKLLRKAYPLAEYADANRSGSFGKRAMAELLMGATWADAVLLAGDFGKNSETTAMLESFITKNHGKLALAQDASDIVITQPTLLINRPHSLLVLTPEQLRDFGANLKLSYAFTLDLGIAQLVGHLHDLSVTYPDMCFVTSKDEVCIVALAGRVATIPVEKAGSPTQIAAEATTWWLQQPDKPFEAVVSSFTKE